MADVQAGRPRWELPNLSTPFPPVYSRDERTLAIGKFQLADYVALGDGNWSSPGFVALGSPWFMAGTLLGSSIAKNRARSRAAADAVPRWVWIAQGTLYTTTHGWHMYTPKLMSWNWHSMQAARMVGPGQMHLSGRANGARSISWILSSDWAELVFALWALIRHPRHPQMISGGWLPPGWVDRAARHHREMGTELVLPKGEQ